MMSKSTFAAILLVGLGFDSSLGQESQGPPLQLKELIEEALGKNPEIVAAKNQWAASVAKITQATALDDPVLSFIYPGRKVETRVGPQENRFRISQKLPFFGKLRLRGEVATRSADQAREIFEAKKLEIVAKVKRAFYELFMAHKAIQINQENVGILRRLGGIGEVKYATGRVSQGDVLKAQVELAKLANELITLRQEKETAEAALNILLNRPPQAPLGVPGEFENPPLTFTLEELEEMAVEQQPLLKALQLAISASAANLALARRDYYPDVTVGVDYIQVGGGTTLSDDDGKDALLFSAGLNIPIWRKRLKARVRETEAAIKASEATYEAVRDRIVFEVTDALVKVQSAERLVDLFITTILPLAEQSLAAATIGYESDRVDFLDLLESQRILQDFQLDYYRALVNYEQELANLERTVGADLVLR